MLSSPESRVRSVAASTCEAWSREAVASLTNAMPGSSASRMIVSGSMLRPVRAGMPGGRYKPLTEEGVAKIHASALDALERLHTERSEWDDLIEIYETKTRVEPERGSELTLMIGDVLQQRLGRTDDAIQRYEDVFTYDPSNAGALERLEALYGEREDWEQLVEVYERSYDAATTDEERVKLCQNIALLHESVFENGEAAADWHHRILQLKPGDADAIASLTTIYTASAQWEDLVSLLETKREVSTTPEARAAALVEMAEVYRDQVGDLDNAISAYSRVLDETAGHRGSLDALEALYEETAMWEQVVETIDRKLAVEEDKEARLELHCRSARVIANEVGDAHGAAERYDRALEEKPGHPEAIEALETAVVGHRTGNVFFALGRAYVGKEDWEKAEPALEQALGLGPNLTGVHKLLGDAYANNQRIQLAIGAYKLSWTRASDMEGYRRLGRIYSQMRMHNEALKVWSDIQALDLNDPEPHCQMGTNGENLSDLALAKAAYERCLKIAGAGDAKSKEKWGTMVQQARLRLAEVDKVIAKVKAEQEKEEGGKGKGKKRGG